MTEKEQFEDTPEKPLLIYDEECRFCVRCVERLKHDIGEAIEYSPFQDRQKRPASVPDKDYEQAVHLFVPGEDSPCRGAQAIYRALAIGKKPALFFLYKRLPYFARAAEVVYRVVAKRRQGMSVITSILWGKSFMPSTYRFSSWLFGRTLGLVALVAFLSYWSQADGLVGPTGIMPFDKELKSLETAVGNNPDLTDKEWLLPTFLWWSPTWDTFEMLVGIGALFSVLLIAGVIPAVAT
ncbi:MAG: DCC1-like thiol-disulfide oxidoreductase family protein, partial [Opitutales bacterium]